MGKLTIKTVTYKWLIDLRLEMHVKIVLRFLRFFKFCIKKKMYLY